MGSLENELSMVDTILLMAQINLFQFDDWLREKQNKNGLTDADAKTFLNPFSSKMIIPHLFNISFLYKTYP